MREHGALHIPDARAQNDFPEVGALGGSRTFLLVPLRQYGELIGFMGARRVEVRPFTPAQIKLLETFADQAVIAIENVRLFRELKEALEQQTATTEILGVIASSPTDIQPVLDTIAENAARLCDAPNAQIFRSDGDLIRLAANYGGIPATEARPVTRGSAIGRTFFERKTLHIHDLAAVVDTEFPESKESQERFGHRTTLNTPLLREGVALGVIGLRRMEVRPFTERQIQLLEIFASQAVIAIENVRLFNELDTRNRQLTEALEQQTATSEILRVIASSPTDIQPVLDVVAEHAAKLCEATDTRIYRVDGDLLRSAAAYGAREWTQTLPLIRGVPSSRAVLDRRTIHIDDMAAEIESEYPDLKENQRRTNTRTLLAMPLYRDAVPIGVIVIRRTDVRPFSDQQVALLKTFADQAVIAIENVRLFQELSEALEQQTATSEILGVIASSPTDIQPVLDTIAASAARICGANDAVIRLVEGNLLRLRAHQGSIPSFTQAHGAESDSLDRGREWIPGRAVLDRETIHIHDISAVESEFPETAARARRAGVRTALATPLLREETAIGVIFIRRTEVKPFTDKQIALLKTFASQAVIAIENVRLFNELDTRNRQLTEALEQQTATSEILGVIASSPTDIQPVLDAVAENATRLCDAKDV